MPHGCHATKFSRQIDGAPTPLSPWGIRLPPGSRIDDHEAYRSGLVEVQDEGSQLIVLACEPQNGEAVLDLCAGAGGKSLALAAAAPEARILATDTNRTRLSKLLPRANRAGARIETRLLNPPNELVELSDWRAKADLVLVDAPCSGQRHLAAQSGGSLAPHARAAGPSDRQSNCGCSISVPSWCAPAAAWSMRSARFCPAKGQGRLKPSSSAIHPGLCRKRRLPRGVWTVPAGC